MRLLFDYPTTERRYHSANTFSHVYAAAEAEPLRIIRRPCGRGAAARRYTYQGVFSAPDDAAFPWNGEIRANIDRRKNPHFKPSALAWDGDVAAA